MEMLVEETAYPEGTWPDKEATDQRETQTTAWQSLQDNHISATVKKTELWVLQVHFSLHHPTRAPCRHARSLFGGLELLLGCREEFCSWHGRICSASLLHHFAPEAPHTLSTFQPQLHARENTKSKMKEKHPKIDIIKRCWISISLHKLTR